MKQPRWVLTLLIAMLFLAACERPVRDVPDAERTVPNTAPLDDKVTDELEMPPVDGTSADGAESTDGEGDLGTGENPDAGETPGDGTGTDEETTDTGETPAPGQDVIYVVQAGDTLSTIAQLYGVSVADMVTVNGLANPDDLDVGQQLIVPLSGNITPPEGEEATETGGDEIIYFVRSGDTLFLIARAYGVDLQELIDYNALADPDRLEVGQEIRIPQ